MSITFPDCDEDIFKNGVSLGFFDMSKKEAEAMRLSLTESTGYKHDWHYVGGRVHMKRAKEPLVAKTASTTSYGSDWA